ncbi:aldo/keto reductase [Slackia heliotrinireducens]|uniref:aldo/keto reductase n=1 Tax=Slackia heliotrinireducens TaxID=84110 RepID=UPI003314533B
MQYTDIQGESLSRLGMGAMRLPTKGGSIDEEATQEIIDYAMARGVNYFDTAYIYHGGNSETVLARCLRKYPRDSYHIATKFMIATGVTAKSVFEKQLRKMQLDYLDFYLVHSVMDLTRAVYTHSGAIEYLMKQKEAGRIRHLGFSSHMSPKNLRKFAAHHDWDFVLLQLNYQDWFDGTAAQLYDIACEFNLPIMVMEPLRGGKLVSLGEVGDAMLRAHSPENSIPSWAFRFLMSKPQVKVVLSGMGALSQIQDNARTFSELGPLGQDELELLEKAFRASHNPKLAPCTGCRYCTDNCPVQIDIPAMMDLYNEAIDMRPAQRSRHVRAALGPNTAEDCISCGVCTEHCPQSIDIPNIMERINDFA